MTEQTKRILPAGPTARLFRVKASWLLAEAKAGRIPSLRAGERYLFDPETVESNLLARARKGEAR